MGAKQGAFAAMRCIAHNNYMCIWAQRMIGNGRKAYFELQSVSYPIPRYRSLSLYLSQMGVVYQFRLIKLNSEIMPMARLNISALEQALLST